MYDARYPGKVKIEYALHPFYGREFAVIRRVCYGDVAHSEIDVSGKNVTVVAWMTERSACVGLRCGVEPVCSLTSLLELAAHLDASEM